MNGSGCLKNGKSRRKIKNYFNSENGFTVYLSSTILELAVGNTCTLTTGYFFESVETVRFILYDGNVSSLIFRVRSERK